VSARQVCAESIVVNGFSKLFAMTVARGLRHRPAGMVRPVQKMQQNFFISAGDFPQLAAAAACSAATRTPAHARPNTTAAGAWCCDAVAKSAWASPRTDRRVLRFLQCENPLRRRGLTCYDLAFDILDRAQWRSPRAPISDRAAKATALRTQRL
jgi:hypothetical protein